MEDQIVRIVRSRAALEELLSAIEAGSEARPDWIHLQSAVRIDRLDLEEWPPLLRRIHKTTRRGR